MGYETVSWDQTKGSVDSFGGNGLNPLATPLNGPLVINNAMAPAFWNIYWLEPWSCLYNSNPQVGPIFEGIYSNDYYYYTTEYEYETVTDQINYPNQQPITNYYTNGKVPYDLKCYRPSPWLSPCSTRFAILGSLPGTLTLTSMAPLLTQYGMPLLYVYDKTGTVVDSETATSVSAGSTEATFPFPSSLAESGYSLAIVNQTGDEVGFAPAGDNLLSIARSQTIQGNPFGVSAQSITSSWQSGDNPDTYGDQTCQGDWTYNSGSNTSSFPVLTQYSLNQVNNGGTTIAVGANPTAVVLYGYQDYPYNYSNGPCHWYQSDTTQYSRAIVANSGNNTVSIVDLVNDAVLSTITVGNHPVALAVSSDGSTAYVANYGDSTITKINLNTNTPLSTIAAGGQPTSVALTASGTLWVGGMGFLTQMNSQNMSVVATQSTNGMTISGLGYSDTTNELIATTMDSSGNVSVDEVNPSTIVPNTLYTAVASHRVSTLGTYFSPRTQTMVRGFTGTISRSYVPVTTNLPGAPPLVVQDGWAVVTATPTGFSITDTSGHEVLVSETTPSPIASIALDPNLNAAYLTMPDSNTLLTVPLPGVGSN